MAISSVVCALFVILLSSIFANVYFAVFSAGLTVGAFTWGILVDIIGRRWAFNLTVGIVAAFGAHIITVI